MAVIKCKMCGGDLKPIEGARTAECEFCGSVQTIPVLDDEKKLIQFERAERLRKQCEFDKAAGIYENIVADSRQEAEAYWGLVLCKYGIEYVDDPATGKKIPTCHRSSFDSIMEDSDFEQALENADPTARKVYREEAKQIEEIRKGIIAVSSNEQPYDIFICYKETAENGERTLDSVLAQDVYDALTNKGYRVFFSRISLEDKLGVEYEPYIFAALNSAKIMLAFGTDYEYFNAVWVKNEWSRFLKLMAKDKEKHLIPCYKGIDAYDMPKEFAKLQAQDLGKVGAIQDLLRGIEKILPRQSSKESVALTELDSKAAVLLDRGNMALENGDWIKADGFFEEALNHNPRSAQAYLGKVFAREQCQSLDGFVKKRKELHGAFPVEYHHLENANQAMKDMLKKYSWISQKYIEQFNTFDDKYPMSDKAVEKEIAEEQRYWEKNLDLSSALRFSTGDLELAIMKAQREIFGYLNTLLEEERKKGAEAKRKKEQELEEFTSNFANVVVKKYQYDQHWEMLQSTVNLAELEKARQGFLALGEFLDSPKQADKCAEKMQWAQRNRQERQQAEKASRIKEQRWQWRYEGKCQHCGGQLKGLFTKNCTACGRVKDY